MHYFPSLHPILQSQGFLSIALGGYGSCIFILRNLSFPHQSRSRSFLFSACFHTSLWPRSTCTVLLLQSVSVSAVTLWSPSWSEMKYGLPFSPHQAPSTSQSTVCLLLLLYFHTHALIRSSRLPYSAFPLQTSRGSQLAFQLALIHIFPLFKKKIREPTFWSRPDLCLSVTFFFFYCCNWIPFPLLFELLHPLWGRSFYRLECDWRLSTWSVCVTY